MAEAQGTPTLGRPWHLWMIGIVGGLWSLIGVLSFMLTQLNVEAVMSRFPPQQREYFERISRSPPAGPVEHPRP